MYNKIPNIKQASLYARTGSQRIMHEILQSEGIQPAHATYRGF